MLKQMQKTPLAVDNEGEFLTPLFFFLLPPPPIYCSSLLAGCCSLLVAYCIVLAASCSLNNAHDASIWPVLVARWSPYAFFGLFLLNALIFAFFDTHFP